MSTTQQPPRADTGTTARQEIPRTSPSAVRYGSLALEFYRSALGKKYIMAVTGVIGMAYIFAHMIGNLKIFIGAEAMDHYAEWLRQSLLVPVLPAHVALWLMRILLIVALVLHVHAAYALTMMNRRARPVKYESKRDYIAADFAARTMRWTGIIVLLFVGYHLADVTWGWVNPGFEHGQVYRNTIASLSNPLSAGFYIAANLALGVHLYHGAWSLFQSLGINRPGFNRWRRTFAIFFSVFTIGGFLSVPIAVLLGLVE